MGLSKNVIVTLELAIAAAKKSGQEEISLLCTTARVLGLAGPGYFRNSANMAVPVPVATLEAALTKVPKPVEKAKQKPKPSAEPKTKKADA